MNIFLKDLKDNKKSIIIWTLSASLMAFFMVSIYDSMIASMADEWSKMMESMPKEMLQAFSITEKTFDNILSYYAMEGYIYVGLILSIFASMFGIKLINKEESDKTTEFILTKPISRFNYITQKLLTLIFTVTLVNIILNIVLYVGMLIGSAESFSNKDFLLYAFGTYMLTLGFGLISFMIASITKRNRGLSGISIGIVFLSFFFDILAKLSDKFELLKHISLFKYVDPNMFLKNGLELSTVIVFNLLFIVTIVVSYIFYLRKDIYN